MDISIITINYNNYLLTLNFIESILKFTSTKISYEIIVVDNCSKIEDYNLLKNNLTKYKKNIRLVRSNINTGFGGGNMYGTLFAKGEYLAFINNDILFTEDCLTSLLKYMIENPDVGVSTPQQLNRHQKPVSCFDYYHGVRKELFGRRFIELTSKKTKRENKLYTKTVTVDFLQGCFMFFDTHKFAEIGGFDTNLFLYFEEMDVCYRLEKKGYTSVLVPETKFIHLHGKSTAKNYLIKKELKISQLYIIRKNYSYLKFSIIRLIMLVKTFFKSIFKPNYWSLFIIILCGTFIENSLKQKQKMIFNQDSFHEI